MAERKVVGMTRPHPSGRVALFWLFFFLVCLSLGYPTLNRYDPATLNSDAAQYRLMIVGRRREAAEHFRHRVLLPFLARGVLHLVDGHVGSWDATNLSLLVVNSAFVAGVACLLMSLAARATGLPLLAPLSALVYLLNFAVSNLFLAGFVDAGEAFFLALLAWALFGRRYGLLPLVAVVGSLAKETFLPFAIFFSATWMVAASRSGKHSNRSQALWLSLAALAGLSAITVSLSASLGGLRWPWTYARTLYQPGGSTFATAVAGVTDRTLVYVFGYLLPLGLVRIRRFPREWGWATAGTTALAFVLAIYHNGAADAGAAFVRPAFSIAGPLLSCSATLLIYEFFFGSTDSSHPQPVS